MVKKPAKPIIEDVINDTLSGDTLNNALNFIAYLRENKISPQWSATNAWKISYKTYTVCFIRLHGAAEYHNLDAGSWHILPFIGEYGDDTLPDEFKEIVWANHRKCKTCGGCSLKLDRVFGKAFVNSCEGSIVLKNPDERTVECAKRLIELRRQEIKDGMAKKHTYVAIRNRV